MRITIDEDGTLEQTEIIIRCKRADEQIGRMLAALRTFDQKMTGILNGQTYLLTPAEVFYIDTVDKKVFLYTASAMYETALKLYELEERFAGEDFLRASKSSIINFAQVKSMRPDFGGRMLLTMNNGERLPVSRQYTPGMKAKLGL